MKNIILAFLLGITLYSCKKNSLPFDPGQIGTGETGGGNDSSGTILIHDYEGGYHGIVHEKGVIAYSQPFIKYDTTYEYTISVLSAGINLINIQGTENIDSIIVDDSGHFAFQDFHRTIAGRFTDGDDSLYMNTDAIDCFVFII